jgi:DNA-binding NarL/FixJ family response regulator
MLEEMGLEAFAARGSRELEAAGETARKRTIATRLELTVQEAQIARLARAACRTRRSAPGCSCPRTVQNHLGKVFTKLDITSRSQLRRILPATADTARPR